MDDRVDAVSEPTIGVGTLVDRTDRWMRAHPVVPDALLALAIAAVVGPPSLEILHVARSQAWALWAAGICGFVLLATVALRRIATEARSSSPVWRCW